MINTLFRQPAKHVHFKNLMPFNICSLCFYYLSLYYLQYSDPKIAESISDRVGFRTIMHVFFSKLEDNEKRMGLMVELFVRNSRESEKRLCTALHGSAPMFVMTVKD